MIRGIILGLLIMATSCSHEEAIQKHIQLSTVYDSTVQIFMDNGGRGSGVHIGNNKILTAWHVVSTVDQAAFIEYGGDFVEFRLLKFNKDLDLAILIPKNESINLNLPTVNISTKAPKLGDRVYACGYNFGKEYAKTISPGYITGYMNSDDVQYQKTWFDAACNPGCSGGPIVNQDFELIGLVQIGLGNSYVGASGMNFYSNFIVFLRDK